jgi:hypothetical protein
MNECGLETIAAVCRDGMKQRTTAERNMKALEPTLRAHGFMASART